MCEYIVIHWHNRPGIRAEADLSNECVCKKIRNATAEKPPYILVVGDDEKANHAVSVRTRGEGKEAPPADPVYKILPTEIP